MIGTRNLNGESKELAPEIHIMLAALHNPFDVSMLEKKSHATTITPEDLDAIKRKERPLFTRDQLKTDKPNAFILKYEGLPSSKEKASSLVLDLVRYAKEAIEACQLLENIFFHGIWEFNLGFTGEDLSNTEHELAEIEKMGFEVNKKPEAQTPGKLIFKYIPTGSGSSKEKPQFDDLQSPRKRIIAKEAKQAYCCHNGDKHWTLPALLTATTPKVKKPVSNLSAPEALGSIVETTAMPPLIPTAAISAPVFHFPPFLPLGEDPSIHPRVSRIPAPLTVEEDDNLPDVILSTEPPTPVNLSLPPLRRAVEQKPGINPRSSLTPSSAMMDISNHPAPMDVSNHVPAVVVHANTTESSSTATTHYRVGSLETAPNPQPQRKKTNTAFSIWAPIKENLPPESEPKSGTEANPYQTPSLHRNLSGGEP